MHILQLSKRNDDAQKRILAAAEKLASSSGLDKSFVDGLTSQEKDPAVRAMVEREGVASLLEALLEAKAAKSPARKAE